jgi:hypothetical protein
MQNKQNMDKAPFGLWLNGQGAFAACVQNLTAQTPAGDEISWKGSTVWCHGVRKSDDAAEQIGQALSEMAEDAVDYFRIKTVVVPEFVGKALFENIVAKDLQKRGLVGPPYTFDGVSVQTQSFGFMHLSMVQSDDGFYRLSAKDGDMDINDLPSLFL